MISKAQKEAQKRYDEKTAYTVRLKLNRNTDADIIEALEKSGNKQGLIKEALRGRKSGRWESKHSWTRFVCNLCGFDNRQPSNYCPNCGAKMS